MQAQWAPLSLQCTADQDQQPLALTGGMGAQERRRPRFQDRRHRPTGQDLLKLLPTWLRQRTRSTCLRVAGPTTPPAPLSTPESQGHN